MDGMISSRLIGGGTAAGRSKKDFYPTPHEVTQALVNFFGISKTCTIWEPACGDGHMVSVFEENGYEVIATDIQTGTDFLVAPCESCDWIITNPPFSLSDQFIRRCMEHGKPFALLLKSQYWHARKRLPLFFESMPSYVLPLTWRPDFMFGASGGAPLMDVFWCVWIPGCRLCTNYIPLEKPKIRETIG